MLAASAILDNARPIGRVGSMLLVLDPSLPFDRSHPIAEA